MELRPYQNQAIDRLRAALAGGRSRVVLYSPTGSGKTEIGIEMIRLALGRGKRVAFLVNRIELVTQASRRFFAAGIAHGIIQGENSVNVSATVTICSIQTVDRRGLPDVDLILIDEAHAVAGSQAYRRLLIQRNALPVIGLTATPFSRGLGKRYKELGGALFEEIIVAATIQELIDLGHLVDVDAFAPDAPDLTGVKLIAGDYNEKQLAERVDRPKLIGSIVEHWLRHAKNTPTVCFATNRAHSMHIVAEFRAAGVNAEHIDCYTEDDERQAILDRVRSGQTMVISNVGILAEGWDFPACRTMILARPTRSLTRYIQMAGRILRPYSGKERGLILDHSGTVCRLGFPTDDLPLELDDGSVRQSARKPPDEALPKACPKCKGVKPPKVHVCPVCGFSPERQNTVEVGNGKLVKIDRKKPVRKEVGQHVYSQLLGYAQSKGYQAGWAYHKYAEFFPGKHPHGLRQVAIAPTTKILDWIKSRYIAAAKSRKKGANNVCV